MKLKCLLAAKLTLIGPAFCQIIQTEPNDSIGTATPSTLVAGSSGGVFSSGNNGDGPFGPTTGNSSGDMDFFSIPANSGQTITFDVNSSVNGTGVDTVVGIYDSAGNLIGSNDDDGDTRDSLVRVTVPADGVYYGVIGNWIPGAADDAGSLPTDVATPGTGRGAPGGAVGEYEVVILLDGSRFLTYTPVVFPIGGPEQTTEGILTLSNGGNALTTITEINFSGDGSSAYSTAQSLPLQVPAGGSVSIDLEFSPSGSSDIFEADLEIVSDDDARPVIKIPLAEKAIDGLLLRLPLDDPAGSAGPAETSGNGFGVFLGVNGGAPQPTYGRPPIAGDEGTSVFLNDDGGSGNYFATANGFPHTASFTYSLWIKPVAGTGEDTLFNRDSEFSLNDGIFGCSLSTTGRVSFRISGAEIVASDDGAVPDDSVHHVVITHLDSTDFGDFSADRTRLYLDGVLVAENTETFEVPEYFGGSNSRLWIATRSSGGTGFNGEMDEFQLYNRELDALNVRQLFDNPNSIVTSAPAAPFVITAIVPRNGGADVELTFNSVPGASYTLQSSSDLIMWGELVDSIDSQGATTTVTTSGNPGGDLVFYRMIRE
ncbi:hypothetical protein N8529_00600 [bacterium]|nr:hypothetical protein [bacterium]